MSRKELDSRSTDTDVINAVIQVIKDGYAQYDKEVTDNSTLSRDIRNEVLSIVVEGCSPSDLTAHDDMGTYGHHVLTTMSHADPTAAPTDEVRAHWDEHKAHLAASYAAWVECLSVAIREYVMRTWFRENSSLSMPFRSGPSDTNDTEALRSAAEFYRVSRAALISSDMVTLEMVSLFDASRQAIIEVASEIVGEVRRRDSGALCQLHTTIHVLHARRYISAASDPRGVDTVAYPWCIVSAATRYATDCCEKGIIPEPLSGWDAQCVNAEAR